MSQLNDKQIEAINAPNGVTIVIAGAGSGKTTVLTERIVKLLNDGVQDSRILAITFTNKAANEMKERTNKKINNNCTIGTFHSFCFKLLRQHINQLGYSNNFVVLDDADLTKIIKQIDKDKGLEIDFRKDITIRKFQEYYISMRYLGEDILGYNNNKAMIECLYDEFYKIVKRDSLLTFDDLLYLTLELFKTKPNTLKYYQDKYEHILVDEYQDTNDVQNSLILMLSKVHKNVFIVGDEDQSIYAFRGANINNLKNFSKVYKNATIIKLEQNYRSTKAILTVANSVINNNKSRIKKELWTDKPDGTKVIFNTYYETGDECSAIAKKISDLKNVGVPYNHIAILYRSGFVSREIEKILRVKGIPSMTYGGFEFFKRIQVKTTLAYLGAVMDPTNRYKVMNIINYPSRKIGPKTILTINEVLNENLDLNIQEVFLDSEKYFESKPLARKLKNFIQLLIKMNLEIAEFAEASEIIDILLDEAGLKTEFETLDNSESRIEDAISLKDVIAEWQDDELSNYDIINLALEETSAIYNYENDDVSSEKVILSTVHTAKGLEFDYVFLPFFDEGIFPSRQSLLAETSADSKSIEEERRLCYVAVTRAKKELNISSARSRFMFGNREFAQPSRFLNEMDENYLEITDNKYIEEKSSNKYKNIERKKYVISKKKDNKTEFNVGDKIKSKKFGVGVIVSMDSNGFCKIAFSVEYGIKTLMADSAFIQKIS